MKIGLINMGIGVLVAAIGLVVSVASYAAVSHSGGTYFVAWGAVAVGAWRFLVGLFQVFRGGFAGPGAVLETTLAPPPMAHNLAPPPYLAKPSDTLPTPVLIIGILLIIQAVVRGALLAILLLQIPAAFFNHPQFVIMSVTLPAILALAGAVAGLLALRRSPAARGVGLTFCGLGLLFQLYGVANIINAASTSPSFHLVWTAWILIPAHIIIYVAGLIVFARSSSSDNIVA
ncbi:MAG: hypothetical protein ACLQIQ_20485 [Beijerinckiaceae bacterium]